MQNHETNFVSLYQNIFRVKPFEWQRRIGTEIFHDNFIQNKICLLCMKPTGGGKTLFCHTVSAQLQVVSVYTSHLLSLGSNQANKLMTNNCSDDTSIVPVNLD